MSSPQVPAAARAAYVASVALATVLGCCAAWGTFGIAMQVTLRAQLGDLATDPQVSGLLEHQRITTAIGAVHVVLQLASSGALIAGASLGLSGRAIGRSLTLGALALLVLATLVEIGTALWMWTHMRAMMAGIPGAQPTGQEAQVARYAAAAGLAPTACWGLVRLGVAIVAAAVLLSPETSAYYARVGPSGPSPRVRE